MQGLPDWIGATCDLWLRHAGVLSRLQVHFRRRFFIGQRPSHGARNRGETLCCLSFLKRHLAVAAIARPAYDGKATTELQACPING